MARKKMKPEVKTRWVRTLLGRNKKKYNQGVGNLRELDASTKEESFCCLGVLSDFLDPDGWTPSEGVLNAKYGHYEIPFDQDIHAAASHHEEGWHHPSHGEQAGSNER